MALSRQLPLSREVCSRPPPPPPPHHFLRAGLGMAGSAKCCEQEGGVQRAGLLHSFPPRCLLNTY